jgi:hypothetical protein
LPSVVPSIGWWERRSADALIGRRRRERSSEHRRLHRCLIDPPHTPRSDRPPHRPQRPKTDRRHRPQRGPPRPAQHPGVRQLAAAPAVRLRLLLHAAAAPAAAPAAARVLPYFCRTIGVRTSSKILPGEERVWAAKAASLASVTGVLENWPNVSRIQASEPIRSAARTSAIAASRNWAIVNRFGAAARPPPLRRPPPRRPPPRRPPLRRRRRP